MNKVEAIPTTPPIPSFTSEDCTVLQNHTTILMSQAGLLKTICETLQRLLTASKQTSSPAVAEGEKAAEKPTAAAIPSSSSIPPPQSKMVEIVEDEDDEEDEDINIHDDEPSSSTKDG